MWRFVGILLALSSVGLAEPGSRKRESDPALGRKIAFVITGVPEGSTTWVDKEKAHPSTYQEGTVSLLTQAVAPERGQREYTFVISISFPLEGGETATWKRTVHASAGERVTLPFSQAPGAAEDSAASAAPVTPSVSPAPKPRDAPAVKSERGERARIRLVVTLDTRVFINTKLTLQEGEVRDFTTPPIPPGEKYVAKIKFDFRNKTGRRILRTHEVSLSGGDSIVIDDLEGLVETLPE